MASIDVARKHVRRTVFVQQMQLLARTYRVVSLSEAVTRLVEGDPRREDLACVTFDDGYANNAEVAAPVLLSLGLPATFYLTTGFVDGVVDLWVDRLEAAVHRLPGPSASLTIDGVAFELSLADGRQRAHSDARLRRVLKAVRTAERERVLHTLEELAGGRRPLDELHRAMTWDQVRALASRGFEVGAHTVTHPVLTRCTRAEAEHEIGASKWAITAQTGAPCRHFALPNGQPGDWNDDVLAIVRHFGFSSCVTTVEGLVDPREGVFQMRRVTVDTENPWVFRASLRGWRPYLRHIRDGLRLALCANMSETAAPARSLVTRASKD
jgi:peptidoglycan/xylan/chitin deacetylase (PgdA/CDA1 family)